ncbi:sugar transferase [Roseibacterium sp. SDUM158016]|uniref:sugar transferase n=1 Tax=Roseicyclus sediminis TaxID=2980997 RepID=UPI0021D2CA76|nr:sugar transferase [Roseibacterium sp. SDUM158016]MCU4654379.1 sugar transferase [Roseibacterium sp. SDUM158016]
MSLLEQGGFVKNREPLAVSGPQAGKTPVVIDETEAVGGIAKRISDIVLAGIALAALAPLMLFVALMIRASGSGPVFYGHERIGLGGRTFRCLKFRTMRTDADTVLREVLAGDPALAAEWAATRKLRHDPRITRIGRVLREYSIDELPQLLNVIRGEMSLVGPRPVVAAELARYGSASALYLSARPGITGLWQISGRSDTTYEARVDLDSRYVTDWSLAGDAAILARTVPAVLGARGSC